MYGNQILKRTLGHADWMSDGYTLQTQTAHKIIEESHHFYFGEFSDFEDEMTSCIQDKPLFMGELAHGIHLPYLNFMLCFKGSTTKYALVVQALDALESGITVDYFVTSDSKSWMLFPCTRVYLFNKTINQATDILEELAYNIEGDRVNSNTFLKTFSPKTRDDFGSKRHSDFQVTMGTILNYFLILYNQSYIVTETIELNKPQKKRKKKKNRLFNYKVLCVKLPKSGKKYRYGARDTTSKGIMPYTEVPGTWKTYSEDAPLFGNPKLFGKFWVPQHVRGSKKAGFVSKDYCVQH